MAGTSDNNSSSQPGLNFGLVGWWPFDGNASDMSGNENHGVVNGATLGADRFGQAGMAYDFDGVDDFIVVSDSNKFDFENRGFSISSWVKKFSQVNSNVGMVLSQWNTGASPGTNQWLLSSSTSGEIGKPSFWYEVANQSFKSVSPSVMGLNEWIHLVGVRESTHTKLFMNGSLVSQNVGSSGSINETGRDLYFGKYKDSNSIFSNISIDETRIYNRALSASEVQSLYQLESTPPDLNASVSGSVNYNGEINAPAIVWALEANGTKVAEQILPTGSGSYSLTVQKGRAYDIKVFIDGTGDGYPQAYEVWKHIGDWNSSLVGYNPIHVDGNLSGIDFNLVDNDHDGDGFTNWQEHLAGTNLNDANSMPGFDFGLVGYWPFDGNASDMSGNENHGIVNGATLGADRFGMVGQAYNFDGVDDFIDVGNNIVLNLPSSLSISLWVRNPQGTILSKGAEPETFSIISKGNGLDKYIDFYREDSNGGNRYLKPNSPFNFTAWHNIHVVDDNHQMKIYIDGSQLPMTLSSDTWDAGVDNSNLKIGLHGGSLSEAQSYGFFSGSIDDVRIYNRALSSSEVFALYQFEKPIYFSASSPLSIFENQQAGSEVGHFSLLNQNPNSSILFELVDGNGSDSNHEFSLDQNGTLRTAVEFDYEGENSDNDPTLNIRVRARDEYNASVERSFVVTILDVNESTAQIPVDQNESVENNSTGPVSNQPIDGITSGVDHNNTGMESNVTSPIVQAYRPIPQTLNFEAIQNDSYKLFGRLLTNGGSSILESGFLISTDILFGPETRRIPASIPEGSDQISVLVENLKPGTTYYYRAYAKNSVGETVGAVKRLKTSEKIDPNAWFVDMPTAGGGWRSSSWFGQFQQFSNIDWIYHAQLGWAYVVSDQKGGLWIWQSAEGWMWTQKEVWPFLFKHKSNSWLYLLRSEGGLPVFYDYMMDSYRNGP